MSLPALLHALAAPGGPLRYAAAGALNSAAGYAGILALGAAGLAPVAANAGGFLIGFLVSLLIARTFTFFPPKRAGATGRYASAFAACWCANAGAMLVLDAGGVPLALAQAAGVGLYAASFYLACRWWVFGDRALMRADLALLRPAP